MKVLLILALVAVALAAPSVEEFQAFKAKFNKVYDSVEEEAMRFANFAASMKRVEALRAEHERTTGKSGSDVYGPTKFSDLSEEEFAGRFLNYKPTTEARKNVVLHPVAENVELPSTFNWVDQGATTPVKDQGQCGSCWAFSATEEIESMWIRAGNSPQILAPQQIVDCDTQDAGCNGGEPMTAYQYVQSAGGIETEDNYPYQSGESGNAGSCNFTQSEAVVTVTGFTYAVNPCYLGCDNQNETLLQTQLVSVGPVSVCVDASTWQDYSGGVVSSNCDHGYSDLDHCVQLVGYDTSSSTPYWIVRNSWNTDWGVDGYIWIEMGKNLCGIADETTFVQVASANAAEQF